MEGEWHAQRRQEGPREEGQGWEGRGDVLLRTRKGKRNDVQVTGMF